MDKTIEYYMGLPYTIQLTPEPEGGWFVSVKELPGCMTEGETPEEALEMIRDAMCGWLQASLDDGDAIPEPREAESYSGKFVVRVPRSLHRQLVETADEQGVSLNQLINVSLAQNVGQQAKPAQAPVVPDVSWPGLNAGVRQALLAAGLAEDAGKIDETLFAVWADRQLQEIKDALRDRHTHDALRDLERFARTVSVGKQKSPALAVLVRLTELLWDLASQTTGNVRITQYVRQQTTTLIAEVPEERLVAPMIDARPARIAEPSAAYPPQQEAAKW